jgi:hypothetical protein
MFNNELSSFYIVFIPLSIGNMKKGAVISAAKSRRNRRSLFYLFRYFVDFTVSRYREINKILKFT